MVEFSAVDDVALAEYRPLNLGNAHGTLGLITVGGDIFLVVVNGASKVATVRPGETVQRIHSVGFRKSHSPPTGRCVHGQHKRARLLE